MPNRTIYLTQANADSLSSEENQSGLVNRLLTNYFAGRTVISPTQLVAKPEKIKKFEELKTKYPPLEIKSDFASEIKHPMEQTIAPPEYGA